MVSHLQRVLANVGLSQCIRDRRDERRDEQPLTFYHDISSVMALLQPSERCGGLPPVRLLDSCWLLARADALTAATNDEERMALALPHRQELERECPEAFLNVDDVPSLARDPKDRGLGIAIGSVSHAWASAAHPECGIGIPTHAFATVQIETSLTEKCTLDLAVAARTVLS